MFKFKNRKDFLKALYQKKKNQIVYQNANTKTYTFLKIQM